jgi:hypothetical protein
MILYADRMLPDIGAPTSQPEGGEAGTGYPWPNCPPFLPTGADGTPLPLGTPDYVSQIPSQEDDAGQVVPAPDGSPCGSYGWLGSQSNDDCFANNLGGGTAFSFLPPCNWCVDAGVAAAGPGIGRSRYDTCLALYACIMKSGCGTNVGECLCGKGNTSTCNPQTAVGPCQMEELAALEAPDLKTAAMNLVTGYGATVVAGPGRCAGELNKIFNSAQNNSCLQPPAGDR